MKKHISILVTFLLISVILLSGCIDEVFSTFEGEKPTFEKFPCDKTTGEHPLTVSFYAEGKPEKGDNIFYNWDFGDGQTSTKQNPRHTFSEPGTYTVTRTIRDLNDLTNQKSMKIVVIEANSLPVITVSVDIDRGRAPLTVKFTSSAYDTDGSIMSYHWDFDDGETSNDQNPTHTFQKKKRYVVELTVTDNDGGISTKSIAIYALGNSAPVATASADKTSGIGSLTVKFTGSGVDSDGSIVSYSWDFDDGSTSNQQNPSHTFNSVGTYNVKLTVEDNEGATGSDTITIKVSIEEEDPGGDDPYEDPDPPTTEYSFSPIDDAYVDIDYPDKKFGEKDKHLLDVKTDISEYMDDNYQYTYLKFDIRSLPDDSTIYSAKLRLYTYLVWNLFEDPYIRVHRVDDDSWSESTITYNNQPELYTGIIAQKIIYNDDDYIEWDITHHIKYRSDDKISLRISSSDSGSAIFYSSESFLAEDHEYPVLELQVVE